MVSGRYADWRETQDIIPMDRPEPLARPEQDRPEPATVTADAVTVN